MAQKHNFMSTALFVFLLLTACGSTVEPTPIPEEPTPTPMPSPTPNVDNEIDLVWAGIQENGEMVVGTSIDYPPFAYFTADRQEDGFDVALMRAVAAKIGVDLKFQDMPINSLIDALRNGQIDVAIGAMAATPEREAVVDFSTIYYVGEDAVLGTAVSPEITAVNQLANSRIGVQSQSFYEYWVRQELLEPGLISKRDLYIYAEANQAVKDLGNGRLDYVILDLKPAEIAAVDPKLSIVGHGLNSQHFAIALPAGATELQAALNEAITALQNEGVIEQLAANYLDIDKFLPSEPQPQITPDVTSESATAVAPTRTPESQFSVDHTQIKEGECVRFEWQVENNQAVYFYAEGQPWEQHDMPSQGFSVKCPRESTNYYLRVIGTDGSEDTYSISITVQAVTSSPVIEEFVLLPSDQIELGQCVTLRWKVTGAVTGVMLSRYEFSLWEDAPIYGYLDDCPPVGTMTYVLEARGIGGTSRLQQKLNVVPQPTPTPQ